MNQRRIAALVAAGAMAIAASASAQTKPAFGEADADGDGKVSIQEAVNAGIPKKEAKNADINDDGKLTKTDWQFVDVKEDKKGSQSES